jgi:hypothetical protein
MSNNTDSNAILKDTLGGVLGWFAGRLAVCVSLYRSLSRVPSALQIRKQIECKCNNTGSN